MFIDDIEKMYDFTRETKENFLDTYSYLSEKEYDDTLIEFKNRGLKMYSEKNDSEKKDSSMRGENLIVEKNSTILRDLRESSFIYENDKLCMAGLEYSEAFEHDGISIYNPYTEDSGRFEVNPIEEYGDKYINWYNSLGSSKYEDAIESIDTKENYISSNWIEDDEGIYDYVLDDYAMHIKDGELYVWIDRGEYKIGEGDFEYLKKVALRYWKMLVYAGEVTGYDYIEMLLYPTEHTISIMDCDGRFTEQMDFDEFIDNNTHNGEGV